MRAKHSPGQKPVHLHTQNAPRTDHPVYSVLGGGHPSGRDRGGVVRNPAGADDQRAREREAENSTRSLRERAQDVT